MKHFRKSTMMFTLMIAGALALAACAPSVQPTSAAPTTIPPTAAPTQAPTEPASPQPTPTAATSGASAQPGDWAQAGFPTVLASQIVTPTEAATILATPFTVDVPAGTFDAPVKFEVLTGPVDKLKGQLPADQTARLAFAFQVTDLQTNMPIFKFNNPVKLSAFDPGIVDTSEYWNYSPDGTYTVNSTGLAVRPGELEHPVAGASVAWVISSPATAKAVEPTDWAALGFTSILASQDIVPGQAITITAAPYQIVVPADAFNAAVTFQVLTTTASKFDDKVPPESTAEFAFAFRVIDQQTGKLISTFNKPVMLVVTRPSIVNQSVYFNYAPDGTLTANPNGLVVKAGELDHPIGGTQDAWVIAAS
jgi:hypothetical protein